VTLFLFSKSDIKTTLIPVTVFAAAAAPLASPRKLLETSFWIWLHLLQFDVSNQTMSPEEDIHNKPDRPLPSGRVTLRQALIFRWVLVPMCIGYSAFYSAAVAWSSAGLVLMTIIYDELGAHSKHWAIRNVVNAMGFGFFELGSTLVAGRNCEELDEIALSAVVASVGIFATTIHTQDFKDCEGDALVGRKTIPITMPSLARPSVFVGLMAWSIGLSIFWELNQLFSVLFCALGLFVSLRFMSLNSRHEDQVSFYWYNVWLTAAHGLPGVWRLGNLQKV